MGPSQFLTFQPTTKKQLYIHRVLSYTAYKQQILARRSFLRIRSRTCRKTLVLLRCKQPFVDVLDCGGRCGHLTPQHTNLANCQLCGFLEGFSGAQTNARSRIDALLLIGSNAQKPHRTMWMSRSGPSPGYVSVEHFYNRFVYFRPRQMALRSPPRTGEATKGLLYRVAGRSRRRKGSTSSF